MRYSIVRLLCCLLAGIGLFSCKKGTLLEGEKFMELSVPFVLTTTDTLDVFVDGHLERTAENIKGHSVSVLLKQKSQLQLSIRKKGSATVLKDTTINVTTNSLSLSYAYDPALGFNQFVKGSDFEHPSTDSIAFILINKFTNFGSGKINVTIFRNNSKDYTANPADSVTILKNIPLGGMSEKVILPVKAADGTKNLYVIVVRDAVSGIDPNAEYTRDFGAPENSAYNFINDDSNAQASPGLINGISIFPLSYDTGSKVYYMTDTQIAFQL
ncbi:hypothetical protein [Chitinophaga sp. Ak27]|uniref:hypothetical protein n=1 Tax=Chitinophaga sp. Ak27 TaxID=2726116 RepID=UPI00145D3405|nr:hypothetical protein [Chitinophaga sp. Ak27]NLU93416.1 hypothetical protein [Chitinophaga sp. Ak27]